MGRGAAQIRFTWGWFQPAVKVVRRVWLAACLVCAGCASLNPLAPKPTPTITPTPQATPLVAAYRTTPAEMCRLAVLPGIKTEQDQGDLLAWAPKEDLLAFVSQDARARWFSGSLVLVTAPNFDAPVVLAPKISGDLAWSPAGDRLAFFTLRSEDNLYTVQVINPDGTGLIDLFPGISAKTDAWASPKAVAGWESDTTLKLWVSCGSSCTQAVIATLPDGTLAAEGAPISGNVNIYEPTLQQPAKVPKRYPLETRPNWSLDGKRVAYVDLDGNVWVALPDDEVQFLLDTGLFMEAVETRWSPSGTYLAVRAGDKVMVYSFECEGT